MIGSTDGIGSSERSMTSSQDKRSRCAAGQHRLVICLNQCSGIIYAIGVEGPEDKKQCIPPSVQKTHTMIDTQLKKAEGKHQSAIRHRRIAKCPFAGIPSRESMHGAMENFMP